MTLATANFVGLSYLVYNPLLKEGSTLKVNGNLFKVLKTSSTNSDYQGMVVQNAQDNTLIVVNRGTSSARDGLVDGQMIANATNAQWNDALALSQYAAQQAKATGATVYATGHSLGGTLTQLEASAWRTFYNEDRPHSALDGKPLPNLPVNAVPKRIRRRQIRSKSLPASGPGIGGGSKQINCDELDDGNYGRPYPFSHYAWTRRVRCHVRQRPYFGSGHEFEPRRVDRQLACTG